MGLDIYAGTLTRYYTRNWKTAVQKFAEANGIEFQTIRAAQDGSDGEELSADEVREIVTQWRDSIIKGLNLNPAPVWNEDYDTTPYYTETRLGRIERLTAVHCGKIQRQRSSRNNRQEYRYL